jgi:hypothetical protein
MRDCFVVYLPMSKGGETKPMTEAEWWTCTDAAALLDAVRYADRSSERKLRLLGCACVRALPLGAAERFSLAVESVERDADGQLSKAAALRRVGPRSAALPTVQLQWTGNWLAKVATEKAYVKAVTSMVQVYLGGDILATFCTLIRDIFGNPFHPLPPIEPALLIWKGGLLVTLARAAYDNRLLPSGHLDPDRLAVLADALEDAGCRNEAVLAHCRGPGPHARGCFVVDALLSKK